MIIFWYIQINGCVLTHSHINLKVKICECYVHSLCLLPHSGRKKKTNFFVIQAMDPLTFIFLFILRVAGHLVENVTAVVWKEQRWELCLWYHLPVSLSVMSLFPFFICWYKVYTVGQWVEPSMWSAGYIKLIIGQSSRTGLAMVRLMGSAHWDRLELALGKVMGGAQSWSRDRDGNKDQFELEHVRTNSWAQGFIPIRLSEALTYKCTKCWGHQPRTGCEPLNCQRSTVAINQPAWAKILLLWLHFFFLFNDSCCNSSGNGKTSEAYRCFSWVNSKYWT